MESDVKFSWTLLKKEYKPILIGFWVFLPLLFFEKASFYLSVTASVFYLFLLIIGIFDFKYRLIFNKILICFLGAYFILFFISKSIFPNFLESLATAFFISAIFILIQIISKNGLGGGDIKFIFCLAFWLGFEKLLLTIYIALISAMIMAIFCKNFRKKGAKIPFGSFLSFGAIISFLYGEKILDYYGEMLL